jgi:Ca-activated chloride channel family protein
MFVVAVAGATATTQFAAHVNLVEVYAVVSDRDGRPIHNLTADDFIVTEDGRPQAIGTFVAGDGPLALAVAIDRSFSIPTAQLALTVSAVRDLVGELRPSDQVMLLTVGSQVEVLVPLTTDHGRAAASLNHLERWGSTSLYDGARASVDAIQEATGRRALILLSDGVDRNSETSASELVDLVRRRDVLVYPVAFGRRRPPVFAELASVTGGRSFVVADGARLRAALHAIALELRGQYLLGYTPSRAIEERPAWRSIGVRVDRPGATVRARDGYTSR